jgi:sterol desaturase/sphingolipid hydroxylase (fatty acid hydroxylase superfamily)
MERSFLDAEPVVRLAFFLGVLTILAAWEVFAPRRPQRYGRWLRWPSNLMLVMIDVAVVRLLFPFAAVGMAVVAQSQGWGLLNALNLPLPLNVGAAFLSLDLAIYFQHRVFHSVPWLWRLHRMHYADLEFDVTTGVRFHPAEIALSMCIKYLVIAALGAPPEAVLVFEILLNATAMFSHSNIALYPTLERFLRIIVVTPEMHRVHHSNHPDETNSNFGFNLPWWDWLLKTYRSQPREGHLQMTLGLEEFRHEKELRLYRMLMQPFRNPKHSLRNSISRL